MVVVGRSVVAVAGPAWTAERAVRDTAVAAAGAGNDAGVAMTPEQQRGAKLYMTRTCFGCHGKDGKTPILPDYPRVAGQNAAYVARQIRDIKSGARANGNTAAMRGILPMVADEEINALAEYIAIMPR